MLTLLCGLAFAGKSTLAAAIAEHQGAVVVSLDAINARRGLHGGTGIAPEEWARTHEQALREVDAALAAARAVVVDDTNCYRSLRDAYRAVAARRGAAAVLVLVEASEALALERLRRNQATAARPDVDETVFADLVTRFEWPGPDEPALRFPASADARAWVADHLPRGARPPAGSRSG